MNINRRRFIGGSLATAAGLVASTQASALPIMLKRPPLIQQALAALDRHGSRVGQRDLIGVVDFSVRSSEPRFHIVDLAGGRIRNSFLVAHGKGSDPANSGWAERFSNRPGSNASSIGSFLTGDTYYGKHGRSQRLHGLDDANDLAFDRAIVIHGANYVDAGMAQSQGRVGRSLGCFAVEQDEIANVIEMLGPNRLIFAAK